MLRQQLSEQKQEQEQEQHRISNNSEVEENRRGLLTNITSTTTTGASSSTALNTGIQSVANQNQSSNNNYGISYGAVSSLSAPSAEDQDHQLLRTTAHSSIGRSLVATTTNITAVNSNSLISQSSGEKNDSDLSYDDDDDDDDNDSDSLYSDDKNIFTTDDEEELLMRRRRKKKKKRKKFKQRNQLWNKIASPLERLYNITKEAVILVSNVDDAWDSPAMEEEREMYYHHSSQQQHHQQNNGFGTTTGSRGGIGAGATHEEEHQTISFRRKIGVLCWFLFLATSYTMERVTFKLMVDRTGPFRMVIGAEFVVACHALILGFFLAFGYIRNRRTYRFGGGENGPKADFAMLPWTDIGLMAVLDTIQIFFAVISGSHVPPVLTAILIHFTIPLTTIINQYQSRQSETYIDNYDERGNDHHGDNHHHQEQQQETINHMRNNNIIDELDDAALETQSTQHMFGSFLIFVSIVMSLFPTILKMIDPELLPSITEITNRTVWNTFIFVLSCIPGSISQLYKQRALTKFALPVDSNQLNFFLSLGSFFFAVLVSPLLYSLQGLAARVGSAASNEKAMAVQSWIQLYPSKQLSANIQDSYECLRGTLDESIQQDGYPEEAHCDFAWGLVLFHVLSILIMNLAVEKICNAGAMKFMHWGISSGICGGIVCMMLYQIFDDHIDESGLIPVSWNISCAVVLLMGCKVFYRVSLETPTYETVYQVETGYEDDE